MINKVLISKIFGKKMPKSKIPDRWIPYKSFGDVIEGTRIICFKVPLQKNVQIGVPGIKKIWDIPTLLSEIPNLGAVIDLTNTARYYNPRDFLAAHVLHRKILMPGREIPPEAKVQEFMDTVDEFLGKDCDALIGVHCTHGLNRTGYMVCRYMRDRLSIPAKEAIKRFEKARGYQIERQIYINDLLGKTNLAKKTDIELVEIDQTHEDNDSTRNGYKQSWRNRRGDSGSTRNTAGYTRKTAEGYTRNTAEGYTRNTTEGYTRNTGEGYTRDTAEGYTRNSVEEKKEVQERSQGPRPNKRKRNKRKHNLSSTIEDLNESEGTVLESSGKSQGPTPKKRKRNRQRKKTRSGNEEDNVTL